MSIVRGLRTRTSRFVHGQGGIERELTGLDSHAQAVPHLGAAWYIPTFLVPVLLVTHFMIFTRLFANSTEPTAKLR